MVRRANLIIFNHLMRLGVFAAAAALLFAGLAGCAPHREAASIGHPDLIVVRDLVFSPGVVTLDPSFGFSLHRGAPGVPLRQRADAVGRAAAFSLADRVTQDLDRLGYAAVRSDSATAEPGGRALIVTGRFQRIYEGHRRQNASVAVVVEIEYQTAGATPRRLTAFELDSRRLAGREPLEDAALRHGNDVNSAAAQVGATIARYVDELARANRWPRGSRG